MPDHRVREVWMGQEVETLEDLLRPGLRAVCVGINPSRLSVDAGHYYQGRLGPRFWERLRQATVVPADSGFADDIAFEAGIGFTDIVKRPTATAKELRPEEYEHGKGLLREKLAEIRPGLVIFTYKKTAEVLFGSFSGCGMKSDLRLGESEVFVMPSPYSAVDSAAATLAELREWVAEHHVT